MANKPKPAPKPPCPNCGGTKRVSRIDKDGKVHWYRCPVC